MTIEEFKDFLFDGWNESDELNLQDIQTDEAHNLFSLCMEDGTWFVLECREQARN